MQATARAQQDTGPVADYPRFYAAVALAQLTSWLPGERGFLLDISGPGARTAEVAACAGHRVLRVIGPEIASVSINRSLTFSRKSFRWNGRSV